MFQSHWPRRQDQGRRIAGFVDLYSASPQLTQNNSVLPSGHHDPREASQTASRALRAYREVVRAGSEPKFLLLVIGVSGTFRGKDVMVRQIEELLLLTCLGGFVAGITYAVTLLH
jgi:hypothetical protein